MLIIRRSKLYYTASGITTLCRWQSGATYRVCSKHVEAYNKLIIKRVPKSALFWNPQGNRKRGRPRNNWRRSVNEEVGRSWNELRFLAADRQKWKGLIDNLCS